MGVNQPGVDTARGHARVEGGRRGWTGAVSPAAYGEPL